MNIYNKYGLLPYIEEGKWIMKNLLCKAYIVLIAAFLMAWLAACSRESGITENYFGEGAGNHQTISPSPAPEQVPPAQQADEPPDYITILGEQFSTNLTQLFLSNNQISDITPLSGLVRLEQLWLDGNPITDFSAAAHVGNIIFEMMEL